MILEKLRLENYKQFRDPLELVPPEGAVGVVGANGAGKTSIFEAILWAFFGSKGGGPRFANDSIPWSGGSAADRTLVEITLNVGGAPYTVSRSLRRGKTDARVFAGGSGEEIVGGPSEVAAWVQENLLGMDRVAFEATFFARQKELEFFAGVTGVERQREIARILGISQVEDAQKLLRSDRNALKNEAKAIERLLEGTDREGLEKSLEEAREERRRKEAEAEDLRGELATREKALAEARAEGERLEGLYRRFNELSGDLRAAESARERAVERVAELRGQLAGLDEDEKTVEGLRPRAESLPGIVAEIEGLEEARRREERRERAREEHRRLRTRAHRAAMQAADLLEELDGTGDEPLEGWGALFDVEDEAERAREAAGLLGGADAAHLRAEEELRRLGEARSRHEELGRAEGELARAREECEAGQERLDLLGARIKALAGDTPVEELLAKLRKRETVLARQAALQRGHAEADKKEADKLARARRLIEASDEHAECPTCRRGFEDDEHVEVLKTLLRQEEEFRARAAEALGECEALDEEADDLVDEIEAAEKRRSEVEALREERTGAAARWEKLKEVLGRLKERAEGLREELAGAGPPTPEEVDAARHRSGRLRALRDAHPRVRSLVAEHDETCEAAAERAAEVEELSGGAAYDAERHAELRERRAEIERQIGRLEILEARLAGRPEAEARLETTAAEEKAAAEKASGLAEELSALGFDADAYAENRKAAAEAEGLRDAARARREELGRELGRLGHGIEASEAELRRYEGQRKLADERASEAAALGEMDKLLAEFYTELTARVRPRLQDEASELVRTLTDGRYDRMEFDGNYGVRLFDGLSDAYEISRFSGGEADVVSLSARVALSKMISARGSGALGFIVLDEVFGSLDADRRRNVLLALDRLKKTFGQIFIISHVGDVQESALLDELWIVEETEEGKSTVRRVDASGARGGDLSPQETPLGAAGS